ncbi:hypothetical protein FRB96_007306 [Tulasnella sp. 330]|nr:hypothetical protein FRB96_007306 [Tulasnella sp. 330]
MSSVTQTDEALVSTGPDMQEDWTYKAEMPMLPEKYQNGFWSPVIAKHRKEYAKTMIPMLGLVIVVMWLILPTYWGSFGEATEYIPNLKGYLVNRDGDGALGQTMIQSLMNNTAGLGVAPHAHLTWIVVDGSTLTDEQVIRQVLDEKVWTAVVVSTGATQTLINARDIGDATYNASLAITHWYNQARNDNVANAYIVPYTAALLERTLTTFNAQFTGQYLTSAATNATAISTISRAPVTVSRPFWYTQSNLRPFTKTVSTAMLLVGNINITILSFILTVAHDGARRVIHPYLRFRAYIGLRIIAPLIIYIPVSFNYAMISLPFHVTFGANYAGGFFIFWLFVYMCMAALGLSIEAMITILTPRYAPLFLVFLIVYNVSTSTLPIILQPRFYRFGYGFPIYNLTTATRTIIFNTHSHLGKNAGIILAWAALSCITIPLFTWWTRRAEVGAHERQAEVPAKMA